MKKSDYAGQRAIAVYASSAFSGLEILAIDDEQVVVRDWLHQYTQQGRTKAEEIHIYKIYCDTSRPYFRYRNGLRYHLDEFIRV